jgi:hypothetical protein
MTSGRHPGTVEDIRTTGDVMWWKVLLAILVVWLAFGLIMALVKGLLTILVIGLVVVGVIAVIKWISSDKSSAKIGS